MTMSMYSSYTPEDFNNIEEDIFGEYNSCAYVSDNNTQIGFGMEPRRSNMVLVLFLTLFSLTNCF